MKSFDINNIELPNISFPSDIISRQIEDNLSNHQAILNTIAEEKAKERAAIIQSAENNAAMVELLQKQLNEMKEQNDVLRKSNSKLEEMYQSAKKEAEVTSADAKASKRLALISLVISSAIAIAAIVFGILF